MNTTMPVALSDTEIWVFIERDCPCGQCIDAARIAIVYNGPTFVALPTDDFYTDELLPASRRTGECFPALAWATVNDITANPHLFDRKDI